MERLKLIMLIMLNSQSDARENMQSDFGHFQGGVFVTVTNRSIKTLSFAWWREDPFNLSIQLPKSSPTR